MATIEQIGHVASSPYHRRWNDASAVVDATDAELFILGRFELRVENQVRELPVRCQSLMAALALEGRAVERARLSGQIWPEKSEDRAAANLRSAVWRLNKLPVPIVNCSGRSLELHRYVRVDLSDLNGWSDRLIAGSPTSGDLRMVLTPDLFHLLPDADDEWILVERERLRQRVLHAADRLIELLTQAGAYARAVDAGLSALAQEPFRESTNLAVIGAHLAEGNRSEALRHYERCSALLRSELGIPPSPELRRMARLACAD